MSASTSSDSSDFQLTVKAANLLVDPELKQSVNKQKFALVSFLSPNDRVKQRTLFNVHQFLYNEVNQRLLEKGRQMVLDINQRFGQNMMKYIDKYSKSKDPKLHAVADVLKEIKEKLKMDYDREETYLVQTFSQDYDELLDLYDIYCSDNYQRLEELFEQKYGSECSVHGFKIRGVFETVESADKHAKYLQNKVEPHVSVYMVPIGHWVPWSPDPDAIKDQHYAVKELNDLMSEYRKNQENARKLFEARKKKMIQAIEQDNANVLRERLKERLNKDPQASSSSQN